jgi:hypothetical protein
MLWACRPPGRHLSGRYAFVRNHIKKERVMPELPELKEEEKHLSASPRGTWVIMLIFGIVFTLAWLALYFGIFLPRGPVN